MTKEEILEKSRLENNNADLVEKEVLLKCNKYAGITAAILATIFLFVQIFVGGGINYGLYAIVVSIVMTNFWIKYISLRKTHEFLLAIGYTVVVVLLSIAHISQLIASSTIM